MTDTPYPLSDVQIDAFRRDGHIVLAGVFTPDEVAGFRADIREATFASNREARALEDRDTFGKAFLQTQNLRLKHEGVAALATSPKLGRIAAALMGVAGVRIYHDQSLFKEPGGGSNPTPWHQDQYYWPLTEPTTLGLWMPLTDVEPEMGGMKFASGTHRLGFLGQNKISDASQKIYGDMIAREGIPVVSSAPIRAGDVSFHYGWTLHAANANTSDTLREAMVVTYYADGMRVAEPANVYQEADRVNFLGSRAVGAVADHPFNTLVHAA